MDDTFEISESDLKASGAGEFPFGGLHAECTRPIGVSAKDPFEIEFNGVRNKEEFYGLRLFLSTATSPSEAIPQKSGGVMVLVRQRRWNDIYLFEFDASGEFIDGTEILPNHDGRRSDITLRRAAGEDTISVLYNGDSVLTADTDGDADFNYLTVRFDGEEQAVDGITAQQPPSE
jgi:hypothetical protein